MKRIALLALALASCATASRSPSGTGSSVQPVRVALKASSVVPLKYASAEEVANTLNHFVTAVERSTTHGSASRPMSGVAIVADPRTNSLLVQAPPEDLAEVLDLIAKLDVKVQ